MKNIFLLILLCSVGSLKAQNKSNLNKEMTMNESEKISYAYGLLMASQIKNEGIEDLNVEVLQSAFSDVFSGNEKMDMNEAKALIRASQEKKAEMASAGARLAGEQFLAENGKRKDVTTLESGLQYEVINSGTGESPTLTSKVKTHYHGTLITGEVFDSSVDRGEPISFPVGGVIKGWTEALQLMKVGDKWRLFIPSDLAYGASGAGPKIGPHSALVFEVELLGIE